MIPVSVSKLEEGRGLSDQVKDGGIGQEFLKTLVESPYGLSDGTGRGSATRLAGNEARGDRIRADNHLCQFTELQTSQVANHLVSAILSLHRPDNFRMFHALERLGNDIKWNIKLVAQRAGRKKLTRRPRMHLPQYHQCILKLLRHC